MSNPNVLVTDGEMNKSLAVVRSIHDMAGKTGVVSAFPLSPAGVSKYTNEQYWIKQESPGKYVSELNTIIEQGDYNHILPVGGKTFKILSDYRSTLELDISDILPSKTSIQVANDKYETYKTAVDSGVPAPTTIQLKNDNIINTISEEIGYPAVLKTGVETEGRFVEVVRTDQQLIDSYRSYSQNHESPPVVQEYLPGDGRGYFGLFDDGELIAGYSHTRIREYPPEGGASACAESEQDNLLMKYATNLLDGLNWNGVVMIEFKEDHLGNPKVIEINPKFWGSLDLAVESGLNFPKGLIEMSEGTYPEFKFNEKRFHWPLSGDLTHAWRRPSSVGPVFRDLLSRGTKSNIQLSDPMPHLLEGAITLVRWDV